MVVCKNCEHRQDSGKFCEACGQPIGVPNHAEATSDVAQNTSVPNQQTQEVHHQPAYSQQQKRTAMEPAQQSNHERTDAMKETLTNYWTYFINLLKNPTNAFSLNESQFINGLITIALYLILLPIGISIMAEEGVGLGFFIFMLVVLAIIFFSAFLMIKIGKDTSPFPLLVTQFAGLLVPSVTLHVIVLIGGIIEAMSLIAFPLILSIIYTVFYVPVFFVYEKTAEIHPRSQKIYLSFGAFLVMMIAFFILGDAIISQIISDMEREFRNSLNPFAF